MKNNNPSAHELYSKGDVLFQSGKYREAKLLFLKGLEICKDEILKATISILLGECLIEELDTVEAKRYFFLALKVLRKYPLAFRGIGDCLLKEGKNDKALEYYDKAVECKLDDCICEVFLARGNCHIKNLEFRKAMYDIKIAKKHLNHHLKCESNYYQILGDCLNGMEKYDEAIKSYTDFLRVKDDKYLYVSRGKTWKSIGGNMWKKNAEEDFRKAISIDKNFIKAYVELCRHFASNGEYEKALKVCDVGREHNSIDQELLRNRGCVFFCKREFDKAKEDLQFVLDSNPKDPVSNCQLAMVFKELGKMNKYQDLLEIAKSYDPNIEKTIQSGMIFRFEKAKVEREDEMLRTRLRNIRFGDLTDFEQLGKGAYGTTFKCRIRNIDGDFVLKIYTAVHRNVTSKIRFAEREGIFIPYHPHVVPILYFSKSEEIEYSRLRLGDPGDEKASPMMIMNFYSGGDLHSRIESLNRKLSPDETLKILQDIVGAVHHLHSIHVIHRDLHMENILCSDNFQQFYVCDLGCSLDLRQHKGDFIIKKSEECMFSYLESSNPVVNVGGYNSCLPPEVLADVEYVNYEKCDVFSVGFIGSKLLKKTDDLNKKKFHLLVTFVKSMYNDDYDKRMGIGQAKDEIDKLNKEFL